jgi:hypothetical protein
VSNKDIKQDAVDNLADALTEDILNTPDHEVLREVAEDYGDARALANKFDQILERAEEQVFETARPAASRQPRSFSLPEVASRWVTGISDLGSLLPQFLSSLTPRTLAWSATTAAVVILVSAAIAVVVVKEQGTLSAQSSPGISNQVASREMKSDALPVPGVAVFASPLSVKTPPVEAPPSLAVLPSVAPALKLSDDEIAPTLVGPGRSLIVAGDIHNARLVLQRAAEAGNATAALELGATYDPIERKKPDALVKTSPGGAVSVAVRPASSGNIERNFGASERRALPDIAMARTWYQRAKDLGSPEAAGRLERLSQQEAPAR